MVSKLQIHSSSEAVRKHAKCLVVTSKVWEIQVLHAATVALFCHTGPPPGRELRNSQIEHLVPKWLSYLDEQRILLMLATAGIEGVKG
jgi:hypothetical protein